MPRPVNREWTLQVRIKKWVREAVDAEVVFLSFDSAKSASVWARVREKARGIEAGTPDCLALVPGLAPIWCEIKVPGNRPTEAQQEMGERLMRAGCFWSWVTSVAAYADWLRVLGVPLHPNAALLAEIADASADSAIARAEAKAGKAPKSYKPRTAKPTAARLRKGEAVRARVLF